jgi:hypothetical protein
MWRWTLAYSQSVPHRPLLAPIYRWPGLKVQGVRYILQYWYTTWTRISTMITLGPSLMGLRGTQLTGSIIYTLVMVTIMIGSSCYSNLWSTREFDTSYFHNPHDHEMNYSVFIMVLKEMMSMESKGQPGAASAASPLLSSQSSDL